MSFKRNCPTSKSCLFPIPRLTYREWIGQLLRMYKAAAKQLVAIFTEPAVMVWLSTELTSPASDVCLPSVVIFMDTILFFQLLAAEIMDNFFWKGTIHVTHFCYCKSSINLGGGGYSTKLCTGRLPCSHTYTKQTVFLCSTLGLHNLWKYLDELTIRCISLRYFESLTK